MRNILKSIMKAIKTGLKFLKKVALGTASFLTFGRVGVASPTEVLEAVETPDYSSMDEEMSELFKPDAPDLANAQVRVAHGLEPADIKAWASASCDKVRTQYAGLMTQRTKQWCENLTDGEREILKNSELDKIARHVVGHERLPGMRPYGVLQHREWAMPDPHYKSAHNASAAVAKEIRKERVAAPMAYRHQVQDDRFAPRKVRSRTTGDYAFSPAPTPPRAMFA